MRYYAYSCVFLVATAGAAPGLENDWAAAFGALPSTSHMKLSPDGDSVSYFGTSGGSNVTLYTYFLKGDLPAKTALSSDGKPDRLSDCSWVSNDRLVCVLEGLRKDTDAAVGILPFTRTIALDRDGTHLQMLSRQSNEYTRGYALDGGEVIDWLPEEDGAVQMARRYLPDDHLGSRVGSYKEGLGVDHLDTRNLNSIAVESPHADVYSYITDGHGKVRIIERTSTVQGDQDSGILYYYYRTQNSKEWLPLAVYNSIDHTGFIPKIIDSEHNTVLGFKRVDGRIAAYSLALDGSLRENLIYANPTADVSDFIQIGRRRRPVGVSFVTDVRHADYFDPDVERIMRALSKALGNRTSVDIVDASLDEKVLLIVARSDEEPGVNYIFNRTTKELKTFLVERKELEGVKLAKMIPITYPASDGTLVPGYLTLPPGNEEKKALPAIVLPHGGPSARDEWGFDWLSQYYADRGYAVLQPNFRGSAGYGDAWIQKNGFKSWPVAIGDVLDAGHWLVKQGIADPQKLAIVGWSYGGYAALQAAVTEPATFKAVVAIAPVTDLEQLTQERRRWSNFYLTKLEIGEGPHIKEGSPARNAQKITAPVLLFHGTLDHNVSVMQSRTMSARLDKTDIKHRLVTFENLDHYLEDASARETMLRESDQWLQAAFSASPSIPAPTP